MWEEDENTAIYTPIDFEPRPNIAIFSFEHTLIERIRANKPIALFSPNVLSILANINKQGCVIVIENRFTRKNKVKENFTEFLKLVGELPILGIFIFRPNRYMKPLTNIMEKIKEKIPDVDLSKSIVVGNNAGRFKIEGYSADYSDYDRAFASNIGIETFRTPEQLFMGILTPRKWAWKSIHINQLLNNNKEPSMEWLQEHKNSVVFITGALCSGKSTLARRIRSSIKDSSIVDINTKDFGYMLETVRDHSTGVLFTVDVLYEENWSKYIELVNPNIDVIVIEIQTNLDTCVFLNRFKLQITKVPHILEYPREDIAKWFMTERQKKDNPRIKYVEFPLVLRTREESFYRY